MKDQENIELHFEGIYRNYATYISADNKYMVCGFITSIGQYEKVMTVSQLYSELKDFKFSLLT